MIEQFIDVSELEAPEPLLRAIDALQAIPRGDYLRICHRMKPCHLYAFLDENGFSAETRRGERCECEVFIWRRDDTAAANAATAAAAPLARWEEG